MDLLDSIMSKMDKPPIINSQQKKLMKEQQKAAEEARAMEKEMLKNFRKRIEEEIDEFVHDCKQQKRAFEPMDRICRSIVRDVADVVGLSCHMMGVEDEDRHVMIFKKEYPLSEEELNAYRNGIDWDPVRAKEEAEQRELLVQEDKKRANRLRRDPCPNTFAKKYERLVGKETGLQAAKVLDADNKQFGFVRSEMKKDKRTIEEALADIKAKKLRRENDELNTSTGSSRAPVQ